MIYHQFTDAYGYLCPLVRQFGFRFVGIGVGVRKIRAEDTGDIFCYHREHIVFQTRHTSNDNNTVYLMLKCFLVANCFVSKYHLHCLILNARYDYVHTFVNTDLKFHNLKIRGIKRMFSYGLFQAFWMVVLWDWAITDALFIIIMTTIMIYWLFD